MWKELKRQIWRWRGVLAIAPTVAGAAIALQLSGTLQLLEWAAFDAWVRLSPQETTDSRIAIVTIGEADILRLRQWPISDADLARLLHRIKQQRPRAIGLDLYRNLPVEPGHQGLIRVFASTPNLIGIEKVVGGIDGSAVGPPPKLREWDRVAASDLVPDADGKIRRSLLFLEDRTGKTVMNLGAMLALLYLKADGINVQAIDSDRNLFRLGKAEFTPLGENDGGYIRVDANGYQILSNSRKLAGNFPTISLTDVLTGKMPADFGRDRIVLIGSAASSLSDRHYTSYSTSVDTAVPGVVIHADLASQILSAAMEGRHILKAWSQEWEWLWIFIWTGVGTTIGWRVRSPHALIFSIPIASIGLLSITYLLFLNGMWVVAAAPLLAMTTAAISAKGYSLWEDLRVYHRQLENYSRQLEEKVLERTLALQQEIRDRQLAEEAGRQLERERELNELRLRFFSMASHELRTPLSIIQVAADVIEHNIDASFGEKIYRNIQRIQSATAHVTQLLKEILEINRAQSGKLGLNPEPVNLEMFCRQMLEEAYLEQGSKQKTVFVMLKSPAESADKLSSDRACVDKKLLRSILINLLSNAMK